MKLRTAVFSIITVLVIAEIVGFLAPQPEWLDIPFHIAGGIGWAMFAAWMIGKAKTERNPVWFNLIFTAGFVMFIGSSWEALEFLLVRGHIFPSTGFTLRDTIGDLFNDGVGSLIGWLLFVRNLR